VKLVGMEWFEKGRARARVPALIVKVKVKKVAGFMTSLSLNS